MVNRAVNHPPFGAHFLRARELETRRRPHDDSLFSATDTYRDLRGYNGRGGLPQDADVGANLLTVFGLKFKN